MTDPNAPAPPPSPDDALPYKAALAELRTILRGIENEAIDLDDLSAQVERAAALIRLCRHRIQRTQFRIHQVLDDLNAPPSSDDDPPPSPDAPDP